MHLTEATLLVVDDEQHYREIITGWFEKEGSRVLAAESGIRALELLQNNEVHAIVTDIRMPGMDGTQLVKQVKALGKYTPAAVSVSGFSDITPREAYDLGIEAQLSKPVERKVLISTVRKSLMPREELWGEPFRSSPVPTVKLEFESLATALRKKQILFGRGGFCISSQVLFPETSSIGFELHFAGDEKLVSLRGVVRWCVPAEKLAGIEITAVDDQGRAWVAELARANETVSFIPRSTSQAESAR
ncbi:MAG: response regulator [Candidatus Acidiferrum sp.]